MAKEVFDLEKLPGEESLRPLRPGYPGASMYPESSSYGYGYPSDDGKINFQQIWRTIRKRKFLILIIVVIATSIATLEIYRTKSIYQASASIQIQKDAASLVKAGNTVIQTDDSDNINTYIYMLKSRPLLQDVVANLQLNANPRFMDVTRRKSIAEALKTITGKLSSPLSDTASDQAGKTTSIDATGTLIRSDEERARLAPYANVVASHLSIEQLPNARLLVVSFTHTDPAIAALVANGVAQNFITRSFQNKTKKFTNAKDWLDRSTRELKAKVEQSEIALLDYTRDHNIMSTDEKSSLATDKYLRLHEQVSRLETDRVLKGSLLEEVKAGRVTKLPESFADVDTNALQKKIQELSIEAAQLDLTFGPKNPKVIEIRQRLKALQEQADSSRKTLEERLRAEYERALRDETSLKELLAKAKTEAGQQSQATIQFTILKQDVDTAKGLYKEFLEKTSQADIEVAEQDNNLLLAEPAEVPRSPVGPQRFRAILITLFLSLCGGIGLAFFLEYLDNTIKTVEDVSRYAQLPALSVIPAMAGNQQARIGSKSKGKKAFAGSNGSSQTALSHPSGLDHTLFDSRSTAAEAYRVLRTSVLLSAAGSPPKTILVTSGQAGEGKTTTTINTAISLAQLNASVLVIDADLRRPSAHKMFGIRSPRGLSTYLSRNVDLHSLIQKLEIPNLSLLPCGAIPPNPAELISSEKMKNMIKELSAQYDHILIDSPPLINVTDPVILSTMVDGVILVVHGGKSNKHVIQRTRRELMNVGAKIFGVVLNNVDLKRDGYNDYYYNRYYAGYGSNSEAVDGP
jgi:polysaccharide biosynthesis transport protein